MIDLYFTKNDKSLGLLVVVSLFLAVGLVCLYACKKMGNNLLTKPAQACLRSFVEDNGYYDAFVVSLYRSEAGDTILRIGTIPIFKVDSTLVWNRVNVSVEIIDIDPRGIVINKNSSFVRKEYPTAVDDCGLSVMRDTYRLFVYSAADNSFKWIDENPGQYADYSKTIVSWKKKLGRTFLFPKEKAAFAEQFTTINNTLTKPDYELLFDLAYKIIIKHKISRSLIQEKKSYTYPFSEDVLFCSRIQRGEIYFEDVDYVLGLITNDSIDDYTETLFVSVVSSYPSYFNKRYKALTSGQRLSVDSYIKNLSECNKSHIKNMGQILFISDRVAI